MKNKDKVKGENNMNDASKIVIAALGGAVIGAAAALLLAPASGKETRKKLLETLRSGKDELADMIRKGKETIERSAKDIKHSSNGFNDLKEETQDMASK